jgi:phosphatidylinositol glycan class M
MALVGRLLLLPQLTLLFYTSLGIAPHNLSLALFVQTFLFVAHNKVITAQYFTWYLCLLPLCSESLALTRRVATALGTLLLAVLFWLGSAYCLEMQGMAVHRMVWLASVLFFGANVNLLGALLDSYRVKKNVAQKAD